MGSAQKKPGKRSALRRLRAAKRRVEAVTGRPIRYYRPTYGAVNLTAFLGARLLGMDEVPVVVLNHLSDTKRRAYIIADNKLAMNAGWNLELLAQEVRELAGDAGKARILLKRYGKPEEVAYAVWFLASRFADYVTGQIINIDGGFKME